MSLVQRIADLATRVGAEIKKKVESTDSRLSDSREWVAETISQAEAEGGAATTRRAWSSQRVRQAAAAWWLTASSVIGRTLATAADAAAARAALVLGTAALAATGQADPNVPTNLDVRAYYGVRYKPAIKPTLLIDFIESRYAIYDASANSFFVTDTWGVFVTHLGADLTITRAGEQTYFDALGVMRVAAANTVQCDHDPLTGQRLGPYIGAARTNLCYLSEDFTLGANWYGASVAVTSSAAVAQNGALSASLVTESVSAATAHYIRVPSISFTAGQVVTFSIYVKDAGRRYLSIQARSQVFGAIYIANIDLQTLDTYEPNSPSLKLRVRRCLNGWVRLEVTATVTITTADPNAFYLRFNQDLTTVFSSYVGDGVSGFYFWGAQVELGDTASPYIPTSGASVTRPATVVTIAGTSFTGFYSQAEGFIEVTARTLDVTTGPLRLVAVTDGTSNNRLELRKSSASLTYNGLNGGATILGSTVGTVAADTRFAVAASYANDSYYASKDGGAAVSDTSGAVPALSQFQVGHINGAAQWEGWVGRVAYFPRKDTAYTAERSKA